MSNEEKKIQPYLVITDKGYWGKGETPVEAAKNANVRGTYVNGVLYFANPLTVEGEIDCAGMGGTEWRWREDVMKLFDIYPPLESAVRESFVKGAGRMKISGGKLIIQQEF